MVYLLEIDANERTISYRLAFHLSKCFRNYIVDCEYNRNIDAEDLKKRLDIVGDCIGYEDNIGSTIYPDIIVHKRGNNLNNLLVIEVKKHTNSCLKGIERDRCKLKYFTADSGLNYKLGMQLIMGRTDPERIILYQNGHEVQI